MEQQNPLQSHAEKIRERINLQAAKYHDAIMLNRQFSEAKAIHKTIRQLERRYEELLQELAGPAKQV